MTPEERDELVELAGLYHDARLHVQALQMANVNVDPVDARKLTIAVELARAALHEAECNLSNAKFWKVKR